MQQAGKYLEGNHDFRNLCKMDVGNGVVNFMRSIDNVTIEKMGANNKLFKIPNTSPKNDSCDSVKEENVISNLHSDSYDHEDEGDTSASFSNKYLNVSDKPTSINCDDADYKNSKYETMDSERNSNSQLLHTKLPNIENLESANCSEVNNYHCNLANEDDGYDMCVATITSRAFLWHQIRAIMSVLVLVGEGKEDPEIVEELLDVNKHPCKPQYSLASELPLCLFYTEYPSDTVQWQCSDKDLARVTTDLQCVWAQHAIR